jgi:myo-inositol-1(or 4)-monophosphatase
VKETVESIIRESGQILLSYFRQIGTEQIDNKSLHDFVTEADKASESYILSQLKKHFPEISILAEESGYHEKDSESRWIVDPLDGTKNFIQGIPYFAISIGLEKENKIIFGMVYDPIHDELFYAEEGKGAFLNDEKIFVSSRENFNEAFLSTGFPFKARNLQKKYFNCFQEVFSNVTNARRCGAAALDLAYLSAGRYDLFYEFSLSPWDMAAGILLIREAGGFISNFFNGNNILNSGHILAGNNEKLHKKLNKIIQSHFKYEDFQNDK